MSREYSNDHLYQRLPDMVAGDVRDLEFRIVDENRAALDLTAYNANNKIKFFISEVNASGALTSLANISATGISMTDTSGGVITVHLQAATTSSLGDFDGKDYYWQLWFDPAGVFAAGLVKIITKRA